MRFNFAQKSIRSLILVVVVPLRLPRLSRPAVPAVRMEH